MTIEEQLKKDFDKLEMWMLWKCNDGMIYRIDPTLAIPQPATVDYPNGYYKILPESYLIDKCVPPDGQIVIIPADQMIRHKNTKAIERNS